MPIPDTTIRVDRECPAATPAAPSRASRKPDSGHTGTISIAIRACRADRNVMKPRIQCADAVKPRIQYVRQAFRQSFGSRPAAARPRATVRPNSGRDDVLSLLVTFVSADAPGGVAGP